MNKKQKIEKALEKKGLSVQFVNWEPVSGNYEMSGREGGWEIMIDEDKTPLRGADNPILGHNFGEVMAIIDKCYVGFDYCPECGIDIDTHEEEIGFCNNCRTDFNHLKHGI